MEDGYFVKWEKHHNAIVSVFDSLYKDNVLVDCTLAAENRFIKAHRLVLMACSPYFEDLLSQHSDNYPILLLNMKFSELQALVDFCYRGEVKLPQAELPGFLNAARLLHIKGLCESTESYKKRRLEGDSVLRKRLRVMPPGIVSDVIVGGPGVPFKKEDAATPLLGPKESSASSAIAANGGTSNSMAGGDSDRSDVDTDDLSSGDEGGDESQIDVIRSGMWYRWTCSKCGEAFPTRASFSDHRKSCSGPAEEEEHPWCCHQCPNTYKNKKDLVRHLLYCGVDTERHICERCGNTYKYERGLKRHKVYCGTDVKPMVCPRCGKTYKYKRGLRRHQQQHCGIDDMFVEPHTSVQEVQQEQTHPATPNTPKEVPISSCKVCGKQYKYRKSFLHHIKLCVPIEEPMLDFELKTEKKPDSPKQDETETQESEDQNETTEPAKFQSNSSKPQSKTESHQEPINIKLESESSPEPNQATSEPESSSEPNNPSVEPNNPSSEPPSSTEPNQTST